MSWRTGSRMFIELWPVARQYLENDPNRHAFTTELIELFCRYDMDRNDLAGIDPELDEVLGVEDSSQDPEDGVAICIRDLSSGTETERATAAEAIVHFVGAAEGSMAQDAAEALVTAATEVTSSELTILALKSIRDLIDDYSVSVDVSRIIPLTTAALSGVPEQAEYVLRAVHRASLSGHGSAPGDR